MDIGVNSMEPKFSIPEIANLMGISRQAVHKKIKESGVIAKRQGNLSYLTHYEAKLFFNFGFSPKTVATHIVKGGVGKTTLTLAIAVRASLYGLKVLCIDIDAQANLTESFDVDPYKYPAMVDIITEDKKMDDAIVNVLPGIDLIPSRIENINLDTIMVLKRLPLENVFKKYIDQIKGKYELILFDCPPSLGQSVTAAVLSSDLVVAPVIPAKYATNALKIFLTEIKNIKDNFGKTVNVKILLNNFDSRKNSSHSTLLGIGENKEYGEIMFGSYVRTSQAFENVLDKRLTIYDSTKISTEKEDIDIVTREILGIDFGIEKA